MFSAQRPPPDNIENNDKFKAIKAFAFRLCQSIADFPAIGLMGLRNLDHIAALRI